MDEDKLENKILYRLIKVVYLLCLIAGFVVVSAIANTSKPYQDLDEDKSFFTCLPSKQTYSFSDVNDWYDKLDSKFKTDYISLFDVPKRANYLCEVIIENSLKYRAGEGMLAYNDRAEVYSENDKAWFRNNEENLKIIVNNVKNKLPEGTYTYKEIYSMRGSWLTVIRDFIFGNFVVYIVLLIAKGLLIYIFFGGNKNK